ncbi:hypothetical protein [Clostridium tetani]|uniref:hypothetical protein n=1 Tax=Clostridium tetani TaxID=1513 RepID=UPI000A8E743A|nr:hypothetical protein [Clostridium tetani]
MRVVIIKFLFLKYLYRYGFFSDEEFTGYEVFIIAQELSEGQKWQIKDLVFGCVNKKGW